MGECLHGIEESWCAICKHGPTRRPPGGAPRLEFVVRARYDGHCDVCLHGFEAGDRVGRWSDGVWRHAACTL